jgi:hypothetical protein
LVQMGPVSTQLKSTIRTPATGWGKEVLGGPRPQGEP